MKLAAILGIIVVAVGLGIWLICRPKKRAEIRHSEHPQEKPETTTSNSADNGPAAAAVKPGPENSNPITDKEEARENRKECRECITLFVGTIGMFGVLWYVYLTNQMWGEMKQQTIIQRVTGINAERAWVGIDGPIKMEFAQTAPKLIVEVTYTIKNFGNGPALKVETAQGFATTPKMLLGIAATACGPGGLLTNGTLGASKNGAGYILFPGETHSEHPSSTQQAQLAPDIVSKIWFIGCASYRDQFNQPHWTRFCFESGNGKQPISTDFQWLPYERYNDTDETVKDNGMSEFMELFGFPRQPSTPQTPK